VELGSHCGEAVEGEVSLLVQEFLVEGKEAFRSMDGSRLCGRRHSAWLSIQYLFTGDGT